MRNDLNKVLITCIIKARKGETNINVFDIMYETSLPYPELKDILDKLVLKNELEVIDIKTYKFIGDINGDIEVLKPKDKAVSNSKSNKTSVKEQNSVNSLQDLTGEERRAYLEKRRRELIERMKKEMEEDNKDDDEEENSDNDDD